MYLAGARFVDFDVVKGKDEWLLGGYYGLRSHRIFANAFYQTPISFRRGVRIRTVFSAGLSQESRINLGFAGNFGVPFTDQPAWAFTTNLNYYFIDSSSVADSAAPFDPRDWNAGQNAVWENSADYKFRGWQVTAGACLAQKVLAADWAYFKFTLEAKKTFGFIVPIWARLFGGWIEGSAPNQEQLFLSGRLRITQLANLIFSQSGDYSPQEHIHIPGDGNMLGYQMLHIRTDRILCLNLELPARLPLRIFGDAGLYRNGVTWDRAYDVGVRAVLGPISFNLPINANGEKVWSARWSIGF
jgi:hypothetical protein